MFVEVKLMVAEDKIVLLPNPGPFILFRKMAYNSKFRLSVEEGMGQTKEFRNIGERGVFVTIVRESHMPSISAFALPPEFNSWFKKRS
jgi:hypothetical protein